MSRIEERKELPILWLHGFLGDHTDWQVVLDFMPQGLRENNAFDLPGHGVNTRYAQIPEFSELLCDLELRRAAVGCAQWHLVGYSMGGRIALHYAFAFPTRVASLTLISSSPGIDDEVERARRRTRDAIWAEQLRTLPREAFLDAWYAQPVFSSLQKKPNQLAALKARRTSGDTELLAQVLTAWGQGTLPSLWAHLPSLTFPAQWIVGADDVAYVEMTHRLKNLLPMSRIVIVPGAGHAVPWEQPKVVARSLADFITAGS